MDLRSRVIGRGFLLGMVQLALLTLVALSPWFSRSDTLEYGGILVLGLTILVGFFSLRVDESLKTLAVSQIIIWPILTLNSALTLPIGESYSLISTDAFFLVFSGLILSALGFVGILLGPFARMFYDEYFARPELPIESASDAIRRLTDEELLEKYWALQSKLRSEASRNDGNRVVRTEVVAELSRRGLRVNPIRSRE